MAGVAEWYLVNPAEAPWGDYGDILVGGMVTRLDDGSVALERAGPYVPPITCVSWDVLLVTDGFRSELEGSGLQGLVFRGVVKKRIVRVDWREWDLTAPEPERLPAGGEPENYILGRKHDEVLSAAIGPIWEIVVESAAEADLRDLIRASSGQILASERAREWLDLHAEGCLRFDRV